MASGLLAGRLALVTGTFVCGLISFYLVYTLLSLVRVTINCG